MTRFLTVNIDALLCDCPAQAEERLSVGRNCRLILSHKVLRISVNLMMRHCLMALIFISVSVFGQPVFASCNDEAKPALQKRDYRSALNICLPLAAQGDEEALSVLNRLLNEGTVAYQARDFERAMEIWLSFAERGDARAAALLGGLHENGKGVPMSKEEAARWYRRAAEKGLAAGQCALGNLYHEGSGVAKDEREAVAWFRKGAEQGYAACEVNLGVMYASGRGVVQDYVEAYRWFLLASAQGEEGARERLTTLNSQMTSEQVAEAQSKANPKGGATKITEDMDSPHSDIDTPQYRIAENQDDFALVVGIEKYSNDLPDAQFSERDAVSVKEHLIALGYPSRNIKLLTGARATKSSIEAYLEDWLPRNVKPNGRVFFYFSGHGAPEPNSNQAYLVPFDGHPSYLKKTAFPLKRLYASLNSLRVKQVVVALDSCFSGTGGRSVLAEGTRPLINTVDTAVSSGGRILLFAATSPNQVTSTIKEQGHGSFTYYFLKGLSGSATDKLGVVTPSGLYNYLKPKVQDAASRQNREQTPVMEGAPPAEMVRFVQEKNLPPN